MKTICFFLLLFCWSGISWGQDRKTHDVFVTGVVWDLDSMEPLTTSSCRYAGRVFAVDEEGGFALRVHAGDTLRFTHVGYVEVELVIPDSLRQKDYLVGIFMPRDTIRLPEFVFFPRYLVRDIRVDMDQLRLDYRMQGVRNEALLPVQVMDREMNQKMQIEKFARSIEMKGHVDVGLGIGTQSFWAWRKLNVSRAHEKEQQPIRLEEIELLKKIFYIEKVRKQDK